MWIFIFIKTKNYVDLKEYRNSISDSKLKFMRQCKENSQKGRFARFAYNLIKFKKQNHSLRENEIIDFYIDEAIKSFTKNSKKVKNILGNIRESRTGRSSSLHSGLTMSNRTIIEALKSSEDSKRRGKSISK